MMPLDDTTQAPKSENWGLSQVQHWELKLCILPHKCFLTDKTLWGKLAYKGDRYIHGPGEPVIETFWIEKHEFLIWQLKR
jgi:hypothetical protein